MTNEQIITAQRFLLMEQGKLQGTGEFIEIPDEQGTRTVEIPEEIHTFNGWKQRGYIVNKGEKSDIKFTIWKARTSQHEDENGEEIDETKMFMKLSAFFTPRQVSPIKA